MRSQAIAYAAALVLFAALMVDDAEAQICGLTTCTTGETCWEATGMLVSGIECDYFESDLVGTKTTLDNWDGLPVGTPARVKGCISEVTLGICLLEGIGYHVRGNTIQSLADPEPEPVPSIATGGRVALAVLALAIGMLGLQRRIRRRASRRG